LSCLGLGPSFQFFLAIHAAAALFCAAAAGGLVIVITVIEVVVVCQFFPGGDVALGDDPDVLIEFIRLTVGFAAVIDEGGDGIAVNHVIPLSDAKQVGVGALVVKLVSLLFREAPAGIFDDVRALGDWHSRITSTSMNSRFPDQQVGGVHCTHGKVPRNKIRLALVKVRSCYTEHVPVRGHSVADSSASRRRNDKNGTVGGRGRAVPVVKG